MKAGGQGVASQPDYVMAREGDKRLFRQVGARSPRHHVSDHRAVVAELRVRGTRKLAAYRKERQRNPLVRPLEPAAEPLRSMERDFEALKETVEAVPARSRGNNAYISEATWALIEQRCAARRLGKRGKRLGRQLHRRIQKSLHADRLARTLRVGTSVVAELENGNVQEAYRHLKGWYRAAGEATSRPCYLTMERQTKEREELYAKQAPPGDPIPINVGPYPVEDGIPPDSEIRVAVKAMNNGRAGGSSRIRAEDLKGWLRGALDEEDPEVTARDGAGDNWRLFVRLVQAVWEHGEIPRQLLWVIVVLIPKGGGAVSRH